MPIYEYKCSKCGNGFEALIRNQADTPKKCPKCGAAKPEKQLSTFAASVSSGGDLPCSGGACDTGSCSTGQCPFGG